MNGFPDRAGLQPERTALAWQRTALTSLALQLGGVVVAFRLDLPVVAVVAAVVAGVSGVFVLGVRHRFAQLHHDEVAHSPHTHMVDVAVAACGAGVVGALLAVAVAFLAD